MITAANVRRFAALAIIATCGGSAAVTRAAMGSARVHLALTDVAPLHAGSGSFEAWLLIGGVPQSLGKFEVDADGQRLRDMQGAVIPDNMLTTPLDVTQASELWVTLEPDGDGDASPAWRLLAGDVTVLDAQSDSASIDVAHPDALGADFAPAAGSFVLTTPTDASAADETSGLWFMTACGAAAQPGLTLPALPGGANGWVYHPAVADVGDVDAIPLALGDFTAAGGADADGGGCAAGPLAAPALPGSDFVIDNGACTGGEPLLPDFADGRWSVIIGVRPTSFTGGLTVFRPLQLNVIPAGAPACASVALENVASALPRGTATLVPGQTAAARSTTWGAIKGHYR